ncbi:histidine phosphatase family protein [Suttonella sp. R2A3]|uniref:SixA phosphatase family protein n=1 Tax=Suttonella sp. R2A3 TaxID=2908648 RepID=UPI001F26A642|nr:histidine phosphatase family protein [Suttonella sp. R2A3]UJF24684.1 histidine phosphatase family protein [Suttonella sp. R2A3]
MNTWILWRHAEAGFAGDDLARPLTERGWRQAEDSALWLHEQGYELPIVCSEATRAQQTANTYASPSATLSGLNPDGPQDDVWAALRALTGQDVIIVGHMPWISEVIAALCDGRPQAVGLSQVIVLQGADQQWQKVISYRE